MKTIDKIIQSDVAPKRKDVVWFDTTTGELKIFDTSGWNTISGGGSEELIITADATTAPNIVVTLSDEDFIGACFATMNAVAGRQIMQSISGSCVVIKNDFGFGNYDKYLMFTSGFALYEIKHNKNTNLWELNENSSTQLASINDESESHSATYSSYKINREIASVQTAASNKTAEAVYNYNHGITTTAKNYLTDEDVDVVGVLPDSIVITVDKKYDGSDFGVGDVVYAPINIKLFAPDGEKFSFGKLTASKDQGHYSLLLVIYNDADNIVYKASQTLTTGYITTESTDIDYLIFDKIYPTV